MLEKKVVQFKARMRHITAAQECEAEEGRRDDNRVVQFKPSMPDTAPARAMAADLMALVERHKHLSHEVVVANLVLQIKSSRPCGGSHMRKIIITSVAAAALFAAGTFFGLMHRTSQ